MDTILTYILIPFVQSMVSEWLFISMPLNYICRSNVSAVDANMATTEPGTIWRISQSYAG